MKIQTMILGFLSVVIASETYRAVTYAPPPTSARAPTRSDRIPPILIEAIIDQESSGDPTATRFEPHLYERYRHKLPRNDADARMMVSSIGLMQVIPYYHLRDCKLKHYSELFNEETNRRCGEQVLKACLNRYAQRANRLELALSCYNGGSRQYAASVLSRVGVATISSDLATDDNSEG